jgi:Ca2+-transporting ATPase
MVLIHDDFASIVSALRMSRVIHERFERVVRYIIAVHVPIAALALVPFLFGWPLILLPLHIILLELVIDPACSMAFDAEPPMERVMEEPPERFASPLLGPNTVISGLSHGLAAAIAVIMVFAFSYLRVGDAADSRTLSFATLLLMDVALIWLFRSRSQTIWAVLRRRNAVLWAITCVVIVFLVVATRLDGLQQLLRLVELHKDDYMVIAGAVFLVVTVLDGQKLLRRWRYA